MATNTIMIFFDPCDPAPENGYRVRYRPVGSGSAYRTWPTNFTASPATIEDTNDPAGTQYEGFIEGDCGGEKFGVPVPWITTPQISVSESEQSQSESGPTELVVGLANELMSDVCGSIDYTVWLAPPNNAIAPGVIIYTDATLTTPVTGFIYLKSPLNAIYNLNDVTGEVVSDTGFVC